MSKYKRGNSQTPRIHLYKIFAHMFQLATVLQTEAMITIIYFNLFIALRERRKIKQTNSHLSDNVI